MTRKLKLALSHYDRFIPLYDGTVDFPGFDVDVINVGQSNAGRHGTHRHERMLNDAEFDACELSLSSYLMARDRGRPFIAIPVFPRRLFSQSQIWVNVNSGIKSPKDLTGRKVGIGMLQTTLSVLAIGDLWTEYDVPWRTIEWHKDTDESVTFDPPADVKIRRLSKGSDIGELLDRGELDAVFRPHPPKPYLRGSKNIVRLFADPVAEERRYFEKNGFYPIMHLIAFREELTKEEPDASSIFMDAFKRADEICLRYYDDPNWSRLAWGRHYFEDERQLMGSQAWATGVARNRANLERFIGYSHEIGLIGQKLNVDGLFTESTRAT